MASIQAQSRGGSVDATDQKPVRKRASLVCERCQSRKVGCDKERKQHGPCTSCLRYFNYDEEKAALECVVSPRRRGRTRMARRQAQAAACGTNSISGPGTVSIANAPLSAPQLFTNGTLFPSQPLQSGAFTAPMLAPAATLPRPVSQVSLPGGQPAPGSPLTHVGCTLVGHLNAIRALCIPQGELFTRLLRAYAKFVHPFMPLLDLGDFVRGIKNGTASPLLIQAMGFAAAPFLDDTRGMREIMFKRAKALYMYSAKRGERKVMMCQSLILLSTYAENKKEALACLDKAARIADEINLTEVAAGRKPPEMDDNDQKLWRRIWWCLFSHDRMLALGNGLPPRLFVREFVPILTLDDLNLELDGAAGCDKNVQTELAKMYLEYLKLCRRVDPIVRHRLPSATYEALILEGETELAILACQAHPNEEEVRTVDGALGSWYAKLPESCRQPVKTSAAGGGVLAVHQNVLLATFYSIKAALRLPHAPSARPLDLASLIWSSLRKTADEITALMQGSQDLRVESSPPPCVDDILTPTGASFHSQAATQTCPAHLHQDFPLSPFEEHFPQDTPFPEPVKEKSAEEPFFDVSEFVEFPAADDNDDDDDVNAPDDRSDGSDEATLVGSSSDEFSSPKFGRLLFPDDPMMI